MKRKQRIEGIKKAFNLQVVRVQKLFFACGKSKIIIIIKTALKYGIQSQKSFNNRIICSGIL